MGFESFSALLQIGKMTLEASYVACGFAGIGTIDRASADQGVTLSIVIEVLVIDELFRRQSFCLDEFFDLVADLE